MHRHQGITSSRGCAAELRRVDDCAGEFQGGENDDTAGPRAAAASVKNYVGSTRAANAGAMFHLFSLSRCMYPAGKAGGTSAKYAAATAGDTLR